MTPVKYKGYTLSYWCKPIPDRGHDYEAVHEDYDGAPDGDDDRCFTAASVEELKCEIDYRESEEF